MSDNTNDIMELLEPMSTLSAAEGWNSERGRALYMKVLEEKNTLIQQYMELELRADDLSEQLAKAEDERREHEAWKARLEERLHEHGNEQRFCSDYDEALVEFGFKPRPLWGGEVAVMVTIRIPAPYVKESSEDSAKYELAAYMPQHSIAEYMQNVVEQYDRTWRVEHAEVEYRTKEIDRG